MRLRQIKRPSLVSIQLLLFSVAIIGVSSGQDVADQIIFGTIPLALGMPEKVVLEQLRSSYRIVSISTNNWAVFEKDPSLPGVGNIGFTAGRLSYINRKWIGVDGKGDPLAVARAFYGVISQFVKENRRTCSIGTHEGAAPEGEARTAYIVCGSREIRVMLLRTDRFSSATVEEVMPGSP